MLKQWKNKKALFAPALLCLIALLCLSSLDSRLKTVFYSLESEKIKGAGLRIALITDLHGCLYGEEQSELIEAVRSAAPDLVLFGGDLFDAKMPAEQSLALARGLCALFPCFYVTGNHEAAMDTRALCEALGELGVRVLRDESLILELHENRICLSGLDDPGGSADKGWISGALPAGLAACKAEDAEGIYSILLSHRPNFVPDSPDCGFDLALSGHTHGGQWRIPGILNGLWAPDQGFFPARAGGRYTLQSATLLISRGLARESVPLPRIWNRPELVIVDILPKGAA